MLNGALGEGVSSQNSGAIIVCSIKTCARMWNFDCDDWNPGLDQFGGDSRCTVLIGLEFDHQIDSFADKYLGIAYRDRGTVTIAQFNQLDSRIERRASDAFGHQTREGKLLALRGVADAVPFALPLLTGGTIDVLRRLFQQSFLNQGRQQPKGRRPAQRRFSNDVTE